MKKLYLIEAESKSFLAISVTKLNKLEKASLILALLS
jgi:hypothetical protein